MARTARRGLKGAGQVRRLLRQMPDAVQAEILALYRRAEGPALAIARSGAPARTGRLRGALSTKILPRSLRFQVGLLGKRVNREFFYGRILEVGRKARTVRVRRSTSSGVSAYALKVSAIQGSRYDIVQGRARAQIRQLIVDPLKNLWENALRRAAMGGGDG